MDQDDKADEELGVGIPMRVPLTTLVDRVYPTCKTHEERIALCAYALQSDAAIDREEETLP